MMAECCDEQNEQHAQAMLGYRGYPGAQPLDEPLQQRGLGPDGARGLVPAPEVVDDGPASPRRSYVHLEGIDRTPFDGRDPDDIVEELLDVGFSELELPGDPIVDMRLRTEPRYVTLVDKTGCEHRLPIEVPDGTYISDARLVGSRRVFVRIEED